MRISDWSSDVCSSDLLLTNLVITTDRRAYHVRLISTSGTALSSMHWTYPHDELLALRRKADAAEAAAPVATGLSVEQLHFNYAISGDRPAWRTVRAFDDGEIGRATCREGVCQYV